MPRTRCSRPSSSDDDLKNEFRKWLSQPSVFNFVAGVNGFYDNGGGKAYVYLLGVQGPRHVHP